MTSERFDKELADLYQQRKQQVIEPEIDFQQNKLHLKYSPVKLLSIFLVAGSASFGIMAIISHLSPTPINISNDTLVGHTAELIEIIETEKNQEKTTIIQTLPKKPEASYPSRKESLLPANHHNTKAEINIIDSVTVKMISLPLLSKPMPMIEPTHKVLPKYPHGSENEGQVEFSYNIDDSGKVSNIEMIASNADKPLERSAKKALSKWRYDPTFKVDNKMTVRFVFSKPKD